METNLKKSISFYLDHKDQYTDNNQVGLSGFQKECLTQKYKYINQVSNDWNSLYQDFNIVDTYKEISDVFANILWGNNYNNSTITEIDNINCNDSTILTLNYTLPSKKENFLNENYINEQRVKYLRSNISNRFLNLLKNEYFEFGFVSDSELILMSEIQINRIATLTWLNELFIENIESLEITCGILRNISRLDEQIARPYGHTLAMAAINHKNDEIKELGVRIFENWASKDSIKILKNIDTNQNWLKVYINEVIRDIESNGILS